MTLLIVTQKNDPTHPVLGFFVEWINTFKKHPSINDLRVIETNAGGSRMSRAIRFWKQISADKSDAVLVHMTPLWLMLGWPIWKLRGTKTALWYTHGSDSHTLRLAVRLADATFTATEKAFPFTHKNVHAVGHGIASMFASTERPARPVDRFAFLSVGRIAPRKRVRETVALFAEIHRQEPRATLTWVGPLQGDPYAAQVNEDISRLGLTGAIRMGVHATAADMPGIYASHDLLLHLSDTGSLDKVVIESLATGCPVFSTNAATAEGLGEKWHWTGALNETAATHARTLLTQGVTLSERQHVATSFALDALINRLVQKLSA